MAPQRGVLRIAAKMVDRNIMARMVVLHTVGRLLSLYAVVKLGIW